MVQFDGERGILECNQCVPIHFKVIILKNLHLQLVLEVQCLALRCGILVYKVIDTLVMQLRSRL